LNDPVKTKPIPKPSTQIKVKDEIKFDEDDYEVNIIEFE
jgi:hypothetical protein